MLKMLQSRLIFTLVMCFCFFCVSNTSFSNGRWSKTKPLEWKWSRKEIKDMKSELDKVKEVSAGVYEYESEHWITRTYHTPRFTIQVAKYMEMFYDVFNTAFLFKADYAFKEKPVLIVFSSQDQYYSKFNGIQGSGGMFTASWKTNGNEVVHASLKLGTYYAADKAEPDFDSKAKLGTIQHEATHCLFQKMFGAKKIPNWLTEGAATYYEAWELRQKLTDSGNAPKDIRARAARRKHSDGIETMTYLTKKMGGALPRLDYLISLDTLKKWNSDNMGEETSYHYAIAETFIDYLMSSKNRRPFLLKIMERLYNNEKPIITAQEQLEHEEDWLKFIDQKWGIKFNSAEIKKRRKELEDRVAEAEKTAENKK